MRWNLLSFLIWEYLLFSCVMPTISFKVSSEWRRNSPSGSEESISESERSKTFPFYSSFSLLRGDVVLYWNLNYDETISFKIRAEITGNMKSEGFLGFGFSPRGKEDRDVVMVTWTEDRPIEIADAFTNEEGILLPDERCDYHMESSNILYEDGDVFLEIDITRYFNTKDPEDYQIEWGTTWTFFMLDHEMPEFYRKLNLETMDVVERPLSLLKSNQYQYEPNLPPDTKLREFTVNKFQIPVDDTTYWCQTFRFDLQEKVHGIKYESLITPGNEMIVHHMELYHCEVPPDNKIPDYSGPCPEKPKQLNVCSKVIAAWAMGAEPLVYPIEAGVPLGGSAWSKHLMIEVHYNNPHKLSGLIDNSGIRYYYTKTLRRFDIGVLEVGVTYSPNLVIPPQEEDFEWNGLCLPSCTSGLPTEGIQVFASQLHAHLSGHEIKTKHFRGDVELPLLDKDPHYTTFFQDIRLLPDNVLILPGDTLVTTCRFNTEDRVNVTLGGYGILDEMCVNYLHYYPKTDLEVCKSTVSQDALNFFFEETTVSFRGSNSQHDIQRKSTVELFSTVDWSDMTKSLWREIANVGPMVEECLASNGKAFQHDN
ncbi:dopamine beta-hydroxylase-like [Apostichopus japonicus]|uniref:dopamine beta-hydroxylase-like n=1 Tax=Stichopus japonicus TaxID=307972 RepID=UPI003AB7BC3C